MKKLNTKFADILMPNHKIWHDENILKKAITFIWFKMPSRPRFVTI